MVRNMAIVKDQDFKRLPKSFKPDAKRRVVLPDELIDGETIYHMYRNSFGQILLDPQVMIPASEVWLFNNPDALKLVQRGLTDAFNGNVSEVDLDDL
jgi:hypothetical protein